MHFSPRRTQRVCRLAVSAPVVQSNKKGAKNRTQLVTRPAVSRRLKLRLETETETEAHKIREKIKQGPEMVNFGASKLGVGGAEPLGPPWIRTCTM